jgi:hypothetical protein
VLVLAVLCSTEYTVDMEPFQIIYLTSGKSDHYMSDQDTGVMDESTLEQITAAHLTRTMRKADPQNFVGLTLYHIARMGDMAEGHTEMFQNGTKVGFGGTMYFKSETSTLQERMISSEYLAFLGDNEATYVGMLQQFGWEDLERALLMNALGHMVELVDGDMVERDNDADALESQQNEDMGKNMSVTMYLVAGLVPLSIILLMGIACLAYRARYHVTWKAPVSTPENSVWHVSSHQPKPQSLCQAQLQSTRDIENMPSDETSQRSGGSDSIRVTVVPRAM